MQCFILLTFLPHFANAQVDVALRLSADKSVADINEMVTFTIVVDNVRQTDINGLFIDFEIPSTLDYEVHSVPSATSFNQNTGKWAIGNLITADMDSIVMTLSVRPNAMGTHFLIGEVSGILGIEFNSTPLNRDFREDDIIVGGISVPMIIDEGTDMIQLTAPPISGGHQWIRTFNGNDVVVSTDSIVVVSSSGTYQYLNSIYQCSVDGCSELIVLPTQPCDLSLNNNNPVYNDNSTPSNITDDTFSFTVLISSNNSSEWTGGGQTGTYNQFYTFGPFPVGGTGAIIEIQDQYDENCSIALAVNMNPCTYLETCTCCIKD